MFNVHTV